MILYTKDFRGEIAKFLTEYARAQNPLDPEHIVVMNGCGSVLASLTAVLCDSEDGYLIPTPYYGSVYPDSWLYGKVRPVHVHLDSKMSNGESQPFMLTVKKLENAMTEATKQGIRVRALILINPHNPLGDIYPAHLLKECLDFAYRYGLHVIVDEIYMLSVYDGTFTSVHSLDRLPDPERTHIIWGFSKDFAMCGVRVGTVYTQSQEVRKALNRLACFHACAGPVQQVLSHLILDQEWINNTFLSANRRRLLESQRILVNGLQKLNIPVLKCCAGLFVWADFRKNMKTPTLPHQLLRATPPAYTTATPSWPASLRLPPARSSSSRAPLLAWSSLCLASPTLLHWLLITTCIQFKTLVLAYRRLDQTAPSYLQTPHPTSLLRLHYKTGCTSSTLPCLQSLLLLHHRPAMVERPFYGCQDCPVPDHLLAPPQDTPVQTTPVKLNSYRLDNIALCL
ncbi:1-aminocyclopropane-1-carboxylate synthase-like protein 1 isoform X3 [Polyodon spathula]|uniref:1-aminocyclopropane-1-carboxylate synthase-like protein 1 isoform X3 n=1 Tax=Polyodon spathula TaxID=7913 RepID=UPI001B7F3CC4|nr:1-aminocyclopropane-1-carboxylate synthase-like protein 1 isoform X3 [Polyodon spathula]XP_041104815.1 1-aminocyclopropane-1-carboxylate synthase-like protein 1 isoform X3 [Polyodon spathula]